MSKPPGKRGRPAPPDHPNTRSTDHPILPADPLLRFRTEFPILDRSTYLISNSLGAMPRGALSPHFYTEDAELDGAFAAIDEIRETRAWRRRRERPSIVT